MTEFVAALGPVNDLAEATPGFVWRLPSRESHGATLVEDDGGPLVLNVSVWESYEALHAFVYRSPHAAYLRRRSRWFSPAPAPTTALWWVSAGSAGSQPTAEESLRRLHHLRAHGPTPQAFTVRRRFDPQGRAVRRRSG